MENNENIGSEIANEITSKVDEIKRKYSNKEQSQRLLRKIWYDLRRLFVRYLRFRIDEGQKEHISKEIRSGVSFKGMQTWVLIFAIFIASLGLNTGSTAVIIGAMLISPLMGPIMGIGFGLGTSDFDLIKRSATNLTIATLFAIITSTLYFALTPIKEPSTEILARTAPTIYDILIALFGGLAGVVALSTRQRGNVIPGVAIATALMPPLCTAGYGIASFNTTYAAGAFQLFFINSVFIALATALGAKFLRFEPKEQLNAKKSKRVRNVVTICILAAVVPACCITYNMVIDTYYQQRVRTFVRANFNNSRTQILERSTFTDENNQKVIEVTLIGEHIPADSILNIQMRLPEAGLAGSQLRVIQGYNEEKLDIKSVGNEMFGSIYKENQKQIEEQRQQIAALTEKLDSRKNIDSQSEKIAGEASVLFPKIKRLAIAKVIESNIEQGASDTISLVVASAHPAPTASERKLLEEWISMRLESDNVRVIIDTTHPNDTAH